ncbi:MAG: DNA-3-methyladenine glycosylase family protein [Lachnospirales bacterium]
MKYIFSDEDVENLIDKDENLGRYIKIIDKPFIEVEENIFESLVFSIIGQQISVKAASTIRNKLVEKLGEVTPLNILNSRDETLKECGLSWRKVTYVKDVADAYLSGRVDFENLHKLNNEEAVKSLMNIKGVGQWTAEMLLIFSLCRKDVLSFNDLGIKKGLMKVHGLNAISKKEFEHYKKLYSPLGTLASLYIWKAYGMESI